jgi:hypothetical protein
MGGGVYTAVGTLSILGGLIGMFGPYLLVPVVGAHCVSLRCLPYIARVLSFRFPVEQDARRCFRNFRVAIALEFATRSQAAPRH